MNDLPLHIDNNIDMFTDDSTLHMSGHNVDEIQRIIQTNLNAVSTWCEDNRMVLNTAKTKCMLITTKLPKVIGVVADENLQWREHVNGVFKKVSQTLALFRRIKHFLPKWSKIMICNAYIMPHFDYCVTVW